MPATLLTVLLASLQDVPEAERTGPLVQPWPNVHKDLRAACERAGIEPVTPNDLRRTFASWLKQAGEDSMVVARLLGVLPAGTQMQTTLGISVLLDGEGWKAFGAPFEVGAAAGAIGLVSLKYRAGRNAVVLALAPTDVKRLDDIRFAPPDAEQRALDGVPIGNGEPGPHAGSLAAIFRAR